MAQITLNSSGIASNGALVLQSNGTTTAVTVSTGQVATFANDAVVNGLTIGRGAGAGSANTALGVSALTSAAGSNFNTALGHQSGFSASTGNGANSFVGYQSGYAVTTGESNSFLGTNSAKATTSGSFNVAIGKDSLQANTTASNNTAVGYQAGYSNTTGTENAYLGQGAGYTSTTGSYNVCVGRVAGYNITTGTFNTIVGMSSGDQITTGSKNTILGRYSGNQGGLDIRTASNRIVLSDGDGNPRLVVDDTSRISLCNANAPSTTQNGIRAGVGASTQAYIDMSHGATTSSLEYFYFRNSNGIVGSIASSGSVTSYNVTSDQRLKENILDADSASSLIDSLKVRKFDWKTDNSHQRYGFIAQELVTVAPEAVHQPTDTEQMMAVDYSKLVPMLVKEVQSLRARVAQLESN
jgi:hypothetical protein